MHLRTLIARTLTVAVAGAGIALMATPAQAAEKPRHCVVDVSVASTPMTCYGSFTTAIAKATGGRVTDAPNDVGAAMASTRFQSQLDASNTKAGTKLASASRALADIIVSIEYEDSGYDDSTLTLLGSHTCTNTITDVDFWYPSLPAGWNDQIGSYRGYANCWVKHFQHINYSGVSTAFDGGQPDMGWMDDETSSIQVS